MTKKRQYKLTACAMLLAFMLQGTTVVSADAKALTATAGVSKVIEEAMDDVKRSPVTKIRNHTACCVGVSAELAAALGEVQKDAAKDQTEDQAEEKEPEPDPIRVEDIAESGTIYVASTGVNLREEPHPSGAYITSIDGGTELSIVGHYRKWLNDELLSDWTKVEYNGQVGYACTEYLTTESPLIDLGQFQITYYCPCAICCDIANRQTASGTWPEPGRTVAVDPSIPFGTRLLIDGHTYIAEDRGGAIHGNHIDVFVSSHSEALQKGVRYTEVYAYR